MRPLCSWTQAEALSVDMRAPTMTVPSCDSESVSFTRSKSQQSTGSQSG
jgi:hypothetical protein